ncbi:MAG: DUF3887 domain-containing protein [Chloroflexota bacterium]
MNKTTKFFLLASLLTALALLAGCGSVAQTVSDEVKESVLAFGEPKTDNLLAGLKENDYAKFSADFDADMLAALTEARFADLKADRDIALGGYVSREVVNVTLDGDFYTVFYLVRFEKQADVILRVVFRVEEPHQVSGLWFSK